MTYLILVAESPICAYISFTSYLVQHAHRSPRTTYYARTNLLVLRILLEDHALCKNLTSEENKRRVRLCRQRQPHLPIVRNSRVLITAIIDTVIDGINHNLKKKLDVDLYMLVSSYNHPGWANILTGLQIVYCHFATCTFLPYPDTYSTRYVYMIRLFARFWLSVCLRIPLV